MPLTRISAQQRRTLEEFYADLAANSLSTYATYYVTAGREMLRLLAIINRLFVDTQLWGMTSHAQLVIRAEDDWKPPVRLTVEATGESGHYAFTYWRPSAQPAGLATRFCGTAKSLAEAERYLLSAMRECGSWADNRELQQLLTEHGSDSTVWRNAAAPTPRLPLSCRLTNLLPPWVPGDTAILKTIRHWISWPK